MTTAAPDLPLITSTAGTPATRMPPGDRVPLTDERPDFTGPWRRDRKVGCWWRPYRSRIRDTYVHDCRVLFDDGTFWPRWMWLPWGAAMPDPRPPAEPGTDGVPRFWSQSSHRVSLRWRLAVLWPANIIGVASNLVGVLTLGFVYPNWDFDFIAWCHQRRNRKASHFDADRTGECSPPSGGAGTNGGVDA